MNCNPKNPVEQASVPASTVITVVGEGARHTADAPQNHARAANDELVTSPRERVTVATVKPKRGPTVPSDQLPRS